jgi:hypothetical protein
MGDPKTEELHVEQLDRESVERERARSASEESERHAHERRAERAAYLREKLGARAASEEEKAREDD